MVNCFICTKEILEGQSLLTLNGVSGEFAVHEICINGLKKVLFDKNDKFIDSNEILEKVDDEWMVVKRDVGIKNIILSYLNIQANPIEVSPLYEWLRKNELKVGNPSDYIAKMKADDLLAVVQKDVQGQRKRVVRITPKGRAQLHTLSQPQK